MFGHSGMYLLDINTMRRGYTNLEGYDTVCLQLLNSIPYLNEFYSLRYRLCQLDYGPATYSNRNNIKMVSANRQQSDNKHVCCFDDAQPEEAPAKNFVINQLIACSRVLQAYCLYKQALPSIKCINEDLIDAYDTTARPYEVADLIGIPTLGCQIVEAKLLALGKHSYKYKDIGHAIVPSIYSGKGTGKVQVLQKGRCTGRKT